MIITSLEKYKGSTYEVTVDKQKIYLHKDIILDFGIKVSKEISEEKLEEILEASDKRRAFERAMYLLDYRDYSYRELFGKLSESYEEDICFYVLNKLAGLGFIDDRRYARNLARKYVEVKKYGFYRASNEMRRKGLSRDIVDEALSEYDEKIHDILTELIMKKYYDSLEDRDKLRKMKNALVRQGYSFDEINTVIRELEVCDDE